ncbi:MAG: hypothetical protein U5N53_02415 [Mycobacterium sp.]|nr:hypothetical protein [Mycobacterium sp.]
MGSPRSSTATETAEFPRSRGRRRRCVPPLADLQPPAVDLSQLDDIEAPSRCWWTPACSPAAG